MCIWPRALGPLSPIKSLSMHATHSLSGVVRVGPGLPVRPGASASPKILSMPASVRAMGPAEPEVQQTALEVRPSSPIFFSG